MNCICKYLLECIDELFSRTGIEWFSFECRNAFVGFLFWLSCNILNKHINGRIYELIFVSKKWKQVLKPKEIKPSFVSQQCVVYKLARDLYDADYVG